ncbi:MBOAT family O-acyltransferase [Halomonas tibetensis]|uniref:Probable alginate O-acetylase n=1 Tax=Halomonas tibetensis TaxID=2259590 RepID=A0ABV7B6Z7_9GAMM
MVFSSYPFLLLFLPLVLAFFALQVQGQISSALLMRGLVVASLVFYAAWNWHYLPLLLGSVSINYALGRRLSTSHRRSWLVLGIVFNLGLLGWFKYRLFIAETLHGLLVPEWAAPSLQVVLPLGISFFTFQQIAWLVDLWRRQVALPQFTEYVFFVTFFPQLIAGPIVHSRELLPQVRDNWPAWRVSTFAAGLALMCLGLAKKVLIADPLDAPVGELYALAGGGAPIAGETPWLAGFGFGVQLYFDFSGYADMAIGLGLMLGLRLPINFASPYKSRSPIDFWRRWHITLSHFLRDYLYIPLGGRERRYLSLMLTMLLGGLWHGAGWQFLLWGGLHGVALCLAHGWSRRVGWRWPSWLAVPLTLCFVMLAWIPFRADSIDTAMSLILALNEPWQWFPWLQWPHQGWPITGPHARLASLIMLGMGIALLLPNSQQWVARWRAAMEHDNPLLARRALRWVGVLCGVLLFMVLKQLYAQPEQAFLYFEF